MQEAAQQELSQQKEQYEERVTHLHEAMVSAVTCYHWLMQCNHDIGDSGKKNIASEIAISVVEELTYVCHLNHANKI